MAEKKKIIIIEDDEYIRDVYKEVLEDAGYAITTATNGEEGMIKLIDGGYALVLLDVMMPKLDGFGVLKQIKEKQLQGKNGPIILLTNLAHEAVLKEGMSLGAKTYLVKSDINPQELIEKVQSFLQ